MLVRKNKMNNMVTALSVGLLVAGVAYFAFAAEHPEHPGKMMGKETITKGIGMMQMCPMHSMMCGAMMKGDITATQDGGVVVMCCNKLYKYDKDLNLVKTVEMKEVEQDCKKTTEAMQKECMEKCQTMMKEKPAGEKM